MPALKLLQPFSQRSLESCIEAFHSALVSISGATAICSTDCGIIELHSADRTVMIRA